MKKSNCVLNNVNISGIVFNFEITDSIFLQQQQIIKNYVGTLQPSLDSGIEYNISFEIDSKKLTDFKKRFTKDKKKILIYQDRFGNREYVDASLIGNEMVYYNFVDDIVFFKENNSFTIVANQYSKNLNKVLFRLIRPIIIKTYESIGGIIIHASAFERKGKAFCYVAIVGPERPHYC